MHQRSADSLHRLTGTLTANDRAVSGCVTLVEAAVGQVVPFAPESHPRSRGRLRKQPQVEEAKHDRRDCSAEEGARSATNGDAHRATGPENVMAGSP